MFVFTRDVGETVIVTRDVVVTILSVEGGEVRLGISAPPGTRLLDIESPTAEEIAEHERSCR